MSFFKKLKKINYELFDKNGMICFHDKYFLIFNELQLDHCHCRLEIVRGSIELNGIRYSCPFSEILYSPLSSAKIGLRSTGGGENLNAALSEMARRGEWARGRLEALESNQGVAAALAADHKWSLLRLSVSGDATIDDLVQFKEYKRLFDPDSEFPFAKKMRFSVTEKDGDGGGGSSNSEDAAATVDRCYILSDEMRRAIERVVDDWAASSAVSVALVGPKNAGKSSLLRAMINRLLAEKERRGDKTGVCVIDGDPGQSEFCTSGSLSLAIVSRPIFGPPFTHDCSSGDDNEDRATGRRVEIVEQMFIGDISPNDPKLYCRSIERLYHTYLSINESGERLPLLINTMGWLQGLGLVYLAFKLTLIDPTHIVHLKTDNEKRDIADVTPERVSNICKSSGSLLRNMTRPITSTVLSVKTPLSPQNPLSELALSPENHRDLMIIAHLFNGTRNWPLCFPISILPPDYSSNPVTRLRCRVPITVRYCHGSAGAVAMANNTLPVVSLREMYFDEHDSESIADIRGTFNIQLVAICVPVSRMDYERKIDKSPFKFFRSKEKELLSCLGMGLVTHVRVDSCQMDLVAGVSAADINGTILVKARIFAPENLFLNQPELVGKHRKLPYLSPVISAGVGRTAIATRKSFPKIKKHTHGN